MCLQKGISIKTKTKKKKMSLAFEGHSKRAGSEHGAGSEAGSGAGTGSQRYGFVDPDPYQNVTDPEH
jgi:hypothetical protein